MSKNDSYNIETLGENGVAIRVSIVAQVNMSKNDSYIRETLGKKLVLQYVSQLWLKKYVKK